MAGYVLWSVLGIAICCLMTFGTVRLLDRHVRREEKEARRLAEAAEAAVRQRLEAERQATAEAVRNERRYRALAEAGAAVFWRADATGKLTALQGWTALSGQPDSVALGGSQGWLHGLHPEDRQAAGTAWAASLASGEPFEAEYRIRPSASTAWRWCRAKGVPVRGGRDAGHPEGRIVEWVGVVHDIDAQRRAEESWRLLAMEVNHRARNAMAVVQSLVRLGGADRAATERLLTRIRALARAHDLLVEREWCDTDLRAVARMELAACQGPNDRPAFVLDGPPVPLAASAVQPVSMVLHELATNAARHGALARDGRVELRWTAEGGRLRLNWTETEGPGAAARHAEPAPESQGFGTRVIDTTIRGQLGGSIERRWLPAGLACAIELPLERLQRQGGTVTPVPPPPPLRLVAE